MIQQKTLSQRLRDCRMHGNIIEAYVDRISRLRASAERMTPTYQDTTGGGGNQDSKASAIAAAVDLERELAALISEHDAETDELKPIIATLPLNFREIVRMRDIERQSWQEIVTSMCLSERWCQRILQRAYARLDAGR
jgi:DNA-directed RNA polymerase specialized sigma24 family protein